jgi:hypothetical protein
MCQYWWMFQAWEAEKSMETLIRSFVQHENNNKSTIRYEKLCLANFDDYNEAFRVKSSLNRCKSLWNICMVSSWAFSVGFCFFVAICSRRALLSFEPLLQWFSGFSSSIPCETFVSTNPSTFNEKASPLPISSLSQASPLSLPQSWSNFAQNKSLQLCNQFLHPRKTLLSDCFTKHFRLEKSFLR